MFVGSIPHQRLPRARAGSLPRARRFGLSPATACASHSATQLRGTPCKRTCLRPQHTCEHGHYRRLRPGNRLLCGEDENRRDRHCNAVHAHRRAIQQLAAPPLHAALLPRTQPGIGGEQREAAIQYTGHELRPGATGENLRSRRCFPAHTRHRAGEHGHKEQQDRQSGAVAIGAPQDIFRLRTENPGYNSGLGRRPAEVQHDLQHRRHLRLRLQESKAGLRRQGRRYREDHRSR